MAVLDVIRGLTFALVLLVAPLTASAQDAEPLLERARAELREGRPEAAITLLERAQRASDDPAIDYELYFAHEQAGDRQGAMDHLEAYLDADPALDEEELRNLEGHLADLRAGTGPRTVPTRDDPLLGVLGWAQLALGIGGLVVFLGAAGVALASENSLSLDCQSDRSLCAWGERDGIRDAWSVSMAGLGSGLIFATLGAIYLALADEAQAGASRSLPQDLDPTMQRPNPFVVLPYFDREGGGVAARIAF